MPNRIQIGLRVSETERDKLRHIAQHKGRSVNNLLERIIRLYIEDYEREHGEIHTADK